jgi:hypothetical protein
MIRLKCPNCQSEVEIEDKTNDEGVQKTAVFCKTEGCFFYKNPLIGLDREEPGVYVSESVV